jgi:hypothetical protein
MGVTQGGHGEASWLDPEIAHHARENGGNPILDRFFCSFEGYKCSTCGTRGRY